MEIEAAIDLVIGKQDETTKAVKELGRPLPIHKTPVGSVQLGATPSSQVLVECNQRPQAGRVWNLLSISIFAGDAHTPIENVSFTNSSTVTAPAANANISGNITPTAGTYLVSWTCSLVGGTPAAPADANNFKLILNGATRYPNSQNPAAIGTYPQTSALFVADGVSTSHVNSVGAGTAGVVYAAQIVAVPQFTAGSLPQSFADLYAGALMPSGTITTQQVLPNVVVPLAAIPSVNFVPDKAIWMNELDSIYAIVTSPPANTQIVLSARVAEYPVEFVEALKI